MKPPILKWHENVLVVRDDLFPYGSKARFLKNYIANIKQDILVYGGSPRWGFAQISIAYLADFFDKQAVVFVPKANELSVYSKRAQTLGATIIEVPMGFTSVCQARAREYAEEHGGFVLPFGLNCPEALVGIKCVALSLGIDPPDEVWTVASSGTLTRGLQLAWPKAEFFAVQVGHTLTQAYVGKATILKSPRKFAQPAKTLPPFPSVPEYDAKAWEFIPKDGKRTRLFWNVGGA